MKILFTLLFCALSTSLSFGQVFFKQRVYGMVDREPKEEVQVRIRTYRDSPRISTTYSTGSYGGGYGSYSASSIRKDSKTYKIDYHPKKSEWENQELGVLKKVTQYYIYSKETNRAIPLKEAAKFFKTEMNEPHLGLVLRNARSTIVFGRVLQWTSVMLGGPVLGVAAMSGFDPDFTEGTGGFIAGSIGVFVLGNLLNKSTKKSIKKNLDRYNSNLSTDKKFAPNLKPSKITFKPVRKNLLNSSIAPTLGFSWRL